MISSKIVGKMNDDSGKENARENLFGRVSSAPTSPVLSRNVRSHKKRKTVESSTSKRNVSSPTRSPILGGKLSSKRRKRTRAIDLNMNSMGPCNTGYLESERKIVCTRKLRLLFDETERHLQIDSECVFDVDSTRRAPLVTRLNVPDGRKSRGDEKNTEKIEIESTSNEDNDDIEEMRINSSDTDAKSSDCIEVEATQGTIIDRNRDRSPILRSSPILCARRSDECHDETFFSGAERSPNNDLTSAKPSQEISQPSSPIDDVVEKKPNEIALVISTDTSPQRSQPDASMQLTLLDSGKKRKKPKRGSLTEKLQLMISKQGSSVRLWRYQLRRTMESGTPVACVTIFVQKCVSHLGRQFLEGFVVEDPHGLLPYDRRFLKIMVVPEIAGKIDMRSEGLVQIFQPWDVLDDAEPILNVTFLRVVPNSEANFEQYKNVNEHLRKRTVIEEFDCPCIGANKMNASCGDRFVKPNVIQRLFKHETQ